ncbi:MAG: ribosome silencing factor [Selenomonadaceae bacterium]|nr:ribosome silencing factor [Selenomonadaceae bacterium]MBR1858692.1 ribosome silencing factor [Selenomonadaceae bacterium]
MNTNELTNKICKAASDKKAKDIITMDMKGLMFSTDYFVICSAPTATQVRAIADNIEDELDKSGVHFDHKEGYNEGEWVLIDYGDVVAHIFRDVNRDYYALEELWNEAAITHFED